MFRPSKKINFARIVGRAKAHSDVPDNMVSQSVGHVATASLHDLRPVWVVVINVRAELLGARRITSILRVMGLGLLREPQDER